MSPTGSTALNNHEPAEAGELTLTIEDSGEVRALTPGGAEAGGSINLDALHHQLIGLFDELARERRLIRREEFELFGALLWRSLVPTEVELLFERELKQALERDVRLRLQLQFREPAADLGGLPWEFAFRPSTQTRPGMFLATSRDLILSRYLPLATPRGSLAPEQPPLRLLVALSKPTDLGPVMASDTLEAIKQFARDRPVEVIELPTASLDALRDALSEHQPHVLHFIGHGRFRAQQRHGEIALLAKDGSARWLDDERFAEMFEQSQAMPRLLFLHLCEGGASDYKADFAGLAPQLVRHGAQAVVAMQYPITNRTAIDFSSAFYKEIACGAPVDDAVQSGRFALSLDGSEGSDQLRAFGAPVLYMRSRNGLLDPALTRAEMQ
jgi:hypothetical protein